MFYRPTIDPKQARLDSMSADYQRGRQPIHQGNHDPFAIRFDGMSAKQIRQARMDSDRWRSHQPIHAADHVTTRMDGTKVYRDSRGIEVTLETDDD